MTSPKTPAITGRCYCGNVTFNAGSSPSVVSYCHCADCRRLSGAPVAAFAAFRQGEVQFHPPLGAPVSHTSGVTRWFCADCGSPLGTTYDYLAGQIYLPLGLIDEACELPPALHSHTASALTWLHIDDDLERHSGSGRDRLAGDNSA